MIITILTAVIGKIDRNFETIFNYRKSWTIFKKHKNKNLMKQKALNSPEII